MTMARAIKPAPVRKSVTVDAPAERAFEVFTAQFGDWWPRSHVIGKSPFKTAVIEPRDGGRWYEIGEDGSECEWGDVLAWEKPARLLLAWRIGADWRYDPDLLTEIEITFTPVSETATRVDLEHRLLENMGEPAMKAAEEFDSDRGWIVCLSAFAAAL